VSFELYVTHDVFQNEYTGQDTRAFLRCTIPLKVFNEWPHIELRRASALEDIVFGRRASFA
jgi:hypothetical protein